MKKLYSIAIIFGITACGTFTRDLKNENADPQIKQKQMSLQENSDSQSSRIERVEDEIRKLRLDIDEINKKLADHTQSQDNYESNLQKTIDEYDSKLKSLEKDRDAMQKTLLEHERAIKELEKTAVAYGERLTTLETLIPRVESLETSASSLQASLEELKNSVAQNTGDIAAIQKKIADEVNKLQAQVDTTVGGLNELDGKLSTIGDRAAALEKWRKEQIDPIIAILARNENPAIVLQNLVKSVEDLTTWQSGVKSWQKEISDWKNIVSPLIEEMKNVSEKTTQCYAAFDYRIFVSGNPMETPPVPARTLPESCSVIRSQMDQLVKLYDNQADANKETRNQISSLQEKVKKLFDDVNGTCGDAASCEESIKGRLKSLGASLVRARYFSRRVIAPCRKPSESSSHGDILSLDMNRMLVISMPTQIWRGVTKYELGSTLPASASRFYEIHDVDASTKCSFQIVEDSRSFADDSVEKEALGTNKVIVTKFRDRVPSEEWSVWTDAFSY